MYNLTFSKIIEEDIDLCYSYIKDKLEAPMAAEKLMEELYEKINHIIEKPYSRPLVHDKLLASLGIRSIKIKNYLLFYNVEEENNTINIITFMYNKRDWANIIKEIPFDKIMEKINPDSEIMTYAKTFLVLFSFSSSFFFFRYSPLRSWRLRVLCVRNSE